MSVIHKIKSAELLKTGRCNTHAVIKLFQEAQNYVDVLHALFELKNVRNVELETHFNSCQDLEICVFITQADDSQLDSCPTDQSALTTVLVDAVEEFNVRLDSYTQQIFKQTCTHVDTKFDNALKSIAKLCEQRLHVCDVQVELPDVDPTIFKNVYVEPPLWGRGKANLMSFDEKILYITPERINGHKFKRIEVTLTKLQVLDLVEKSFADNLYGDYVIKLNGHRYELVSFEVVQMTFDF